MDPIDGAEGLIRPVLALGLVRIGLISPSVRPGRRGPAAGASAATPDLGSYTGRCRTVAGAWCGTPVAAGQPVTTWGAQQRTRTSPALGAKDSNRSNGWAKWSVRNRPSGRDCSHISLQSARHGVRMLTVPNIGMAL